MTQELGLLDTLVGAWLPGAVSAMNVLIMRASFTAVPDEIEDAAFLDGASEWQRFTALFLPSSIGAMLVVVVNSFITAWDDFLWPLLVLRSESSFTVSLGLARLSASSFGFDPRVVMAGSIIAVVPVLVVFIVLQRWFHRGVAAGGVK
jgi:multiple sugar transport system permease protein